MIYRSFLSRAWLPILLVFLVASAAAAAFLPRFGVEAGTNVLLNEDDPDLAYYNLTRPQWAYDEYAIVCARRADWFTPESIQLLSEFVDELKKAAHVKQGAVMSILSVPLLRNRAGMIPVPTKLSDSGIDLAKAKEEMLAHTQAVGNLVSKDGRDLSILVYLDVPKEVEELEPEWSAAHGLKDRARIAAIEKDYLAAMDHLRIRRIAMMADLRRITAAWRPKMEEPIRLSGLPVINVNLVEHVAADIRTFGILSFVLFTLAFLAVYRKIRWAALPILACLLPVLLIVGAMAMTGKKVTVITSNLPVLLFVLMLPYTVYFVERYRERRSLFPSESGLDTAAGAGADIWTPCLYSCTTTMAGFASLLTSGINPVRVFGLMMTIGMGVGLACVFLFLPSANRPLRPLAGGPVTTLTHPRGPVRFLEKAVLGAPGWIVGISVIVLGVSVWGTTRIKVETKFIDYFWPGSEVYQGLEYIDTRMGGTTPLEVMLTSKQPDFFKTREGVRAIDAAQSYFFKPELGKVVGNVRSLKTLQDEVRKHPSTSKFTVEQLSKIKFAEGLIREFANPDFTVSRVLVRFRETEPTLHRNNVLRGLREHLAQAPELKDLEVRPTGIFLLYANMLNSLIESQKQTFLIVLGAIYLMLVILFRAPVLAAVVLVPQLLPVFVCLGTMGFTGIPLDLVTVMIASIAMGVGIDAAIQYTVRYRKELKAAGGDRRDAVTRSHATIGRAIWIATSIVVVGFIVLALSKFVPTVYFGVFTALAMIMGQFAALTLLPSLFLLFKLPR